MSEEKMMKETKKFRIYRDNYNFIGVLAYSKEEARKMLSKILGVSESLIGIDDKSWSLDEELGNTKTVTLCFREEHFEKGSPGYHINIDAERENGETLGYLSYPNVDRSVRTGIFNLCYGRYLVFERFFRGTKAEKVKVVVPREKFLAALIKCRWDFERHPL